MAETLTCHRCQCPLVVQEQLADVWVTCPRCLASVRNPHAGQIHASEPTETPRYCKVCGDPVQPTWRACPACGALTRPQRPAASFDRDVNQDRTGGWIVLGILVALLVVGTVFFLVTGGGELVAASPEGLTIVIAGFVIIALVIGGIAVLMRSPDSSTKAIGASLGAVAISLVVALVVILLIIAAICAGINNFLTSCSCKQPPQQQKKAPANPQPPAPRQP